MAKYRQNRINDSVTEEVSAILREVKDPRVAEALLTITSSDVTADLKYAKIHLESQLVEKQTSKTVTKVVSLGLVFAFLSGLTSILLSMFSRGVLIGVDIVVKPFFVYLLPVVVGVCYLAFAILYYSHSMQKAFDKVSR